MSDTFELYITKRKRRWWNRWRFDLVNYPFRVDVIVNGQSVDYLHCRSYDDAYRHGREMARAAKRRLEDERRTPVRIELDLRSFEQVRADLQEGGA